ncbi:MAG: hypothetical protein HYS07_08105 [Chlamydiae bacterium]|nr:hypothetical protein [Chlamydiota bacterium]MBI3277692.1 hypothetical protein [Chlamydiota bacterium]
MIIKRLWVAALFLFLFLEGFLWLFNLLFLPLIFEKFLKIPLSKKQGWTLSYKDIHFNLFHGFIARNIQGLKAVKKGLILARIDSLHVSFNFSSFFHGQWAVKSFALGPGKIQWLTQGNDVKEFRFKNIHGGKTEKTESVTGLWGIAHVEIDSLHSDKLSLQIEKIQVKLEDQEMVASSEDTLFRGESFTWKLNVDKKGKNFYAEGELSGLGLKFIGTFKNQAFNFLMLSDREGSKDSLPTRVLSRVIFNQGKPEAAWIKGTINREDLASIVKVMRRKGAPIQFKSAMDIDGEWREGRGQMHLKMPSLEVRSFPLQNLVLNLGIKKSLLWVERFDFESCEGKFLGGGWNDFSAPNPYGGKMILEDLDLRSFTQAVLKEGLEGKVHGSIHFFSPQGSRDSLRAVGILKVDEGNLWKMNLMQGVLKVFEIIFPGLGDVRFSSCIANFFVTDGKMIVDDLTMTSSVVVIKMTGEIGLKEKDLNLHVVFSLKPAGLKDKTFLSKVVTAGLIVTGSQVWKAEIRGTLEHPVATPVFFPLIRPVTDLFTNPFKQFKKKESF